MQYQTECAWLKSVCAGPSTTPYVLRLPVCSWAEAAPRRCASTRHRGKCCCGSATDAACGASVCAATGGFSRDRGCPACAPAGAVPLGDSHRVPAQLAARRFGWVTTAQKGRHNREGSMCSRHRWVQHTCAQCVKSPSHVDLCLAQRARARYLSNRTCCNPSAACQTQSTHAGYGAGVSERQQRIELQGWLLCEVAAVGEVTQGLRSTDHGAPSR
jgi:hypothetical protein